jgi:hypothetical protein
VHRPPEAAAVTSTEAAVTASGGLGAVAGEGVGVGVAPEDSDRTTTQAPARTVAFVAATVWLNRVVAV